MNFLLIFYSILSFFVFLIFGKISYKLNLLDIPKKRKVHLKPTAFTGGILISSILIIGILLFDFSSKNLNSILSIAFLISVVGLLDDYYSFNAGGKLSLQVIPIFYLVIFEGLTLNSLGNYEYFKLELGSFATPFTLISVLFLTNSFNYFDGLDGALGFSSISVLGILYFLIPAQNYQLYLIIIIIPMCIFLIYNFSLIKLPKLFLGDSGSLLLGFIASFTLINLANENLVHPILIAWSVVIFAYEFLSINLIRLYKKKDPFKAGLDHLHHILYNKFKSIFLTNLFITSLNIILFIIGYLTFSLVGATASLFSFIVLFMIYLFLRNKYSKNIISVKLK